MDKIRLIPFKVNFEHVKRIQTALNWMLYISVVLGISILLVIRFKKSDAIQYSDNINYIVGTLSLFYFIGDLSKRFLLMLAEQRRRKDFIDNSLETNLSDFKSKGYYSNEEISPGIYKMGVNCFENAFFSSAISGKMIFRLIILSLLVILIFCLLIMSSDKITIATFLQFALPYSILQETIIVVIYYFQVNSILNYFKLLFSSAQEHKRDLLLIHNIINYESTISWAGVILSNRIFKKYNEELSAQWERIKQDHNIKPE